MEPETLGPWAMGCLEECQRLFVEDLQRSAQSVKENLAMAARFFLRVVSTHSESKVAACLQTCT